MTGIMVDGINADVPAILARWGRTTPVAYPVDGLYAWTANQIGDFSHHMGYSILAGNNSSHVAARARCKDVEARWRVGGDAGPQDVPPWLAARAAFCQRAGHPDDATVYCSLYTVPAVLAELGGNVEAVPRWWLAWYWGRPTAPTAEQVRAALTDQEGVTLPLDRIWGCQFVSYQSWDVTTVYGTF